MKKWYVAQTFSKFENKVVSDLTSRRNSMNLQDKIFRILAPEEEYVEIKHDKRSNKDVEVVKKRKIYPGYIFVEIEVETEIDDDTWYIIRNTPGVTGLLGSSGGGTKPIPVSTREINRILQREGLMSKDELPFQEGDTVVITKGSLKGLEGIVSNINADRKVATVIVDMFSRPTPNEVSFDELRKI